jgi:hypothetical protein
MPRPILGTQYPNRNGSLQAEIAPAAKSTSGALSGARLEQRLRQERSKAYVAVLARLDAGTHQQNQAALQSLLETIAAEFPELAIDQRPLGFVSRCYLGAPYVVHICDLGSNIVEHFETYRNMPALFERARSLALHSGYVAIEVYPDKLRAIADDGSVSVIEK